MHTLRSFSKNVNLLNVILIASLFLIANYVVLPMFNVRVTYTPAAPKKSSTIVEEELGQSKIPSLSDYTIIAEQNLFHPERKIPPAKEETLPQPKPEFVLYGTVVSDDTKLAYMEDKRSPRTTPGRGTRQTVLKIGQTMSGFTLKEIDVDKVVMVRGEETIVIKVTDTNVKKDRDAKAPAQVQKAPAPTVKSAPPPPTPPPRTDQPTKPKRTPLQPRQAQ